MERDPDDLFGGSYCVVGVADPDKLQSDLAAPMPSMLNRPVRPRLSVETLRGKTVLVVFVPEAAAAEKPIYLSKLGLPRGAFRRVRVDRPGGQREDDLVALYAGRSRQLTARYCTTPTCRTSTHFRGAGVLPPCASAPTPVPKS